jgi:ABC-type multidrug transport system fused ATPase/permease subunit
VRMLKLLLVRASRKIHDEFVESVMGATFRWVDSHSLSPYHSPTPPSFLDTTPSSRILARATGDIEGVDFGVTQRMNWVFDITISMVVYLGAICIISPRVLVPGIVVAAAGAAVGQVYVRAMLGMKRQMSVEKAPVLATFSSAIAGLGMR